MSTLALLVLLVAAPPKVGDVAPDFTVTDVDGKTLALRELVKTGPVVLAFYPKAFTSGCTAEMQSFRDRAGELTSCKAQVLAISTDDAETQRRFKAELKSPYAFIADPDAKLVNLYDVKTPVVSYAKRRTFVIGQDGRVKSVHESDDAIDPTGAINACRALSTSGKP